MMKRIASFIVMLAVLVGLFSSVYGLNVSAADEGVMVFSPTEITLTSSVKYKNPFTETEIDAVFTHSDGTKISIPGFWKGDDTWAVRFSPTKTGKWDYVITCKDETNSGLTKTGSLVAGENTKNTETAKHGFLTTVKNQHYYQYMDGTPFLWTGDTNWQAFSSVSTTLCNYPGCTCSNQFKHIVDNRIEKGFNVYQTYFVPGSGNGEKSVWKDESRNKLDTELFDEKIDYMFDYLDDNGFVIALGFGLNEGTPRRMSEESMLRFARYIVARYGGYNIVWIGGQEITNLMPSITEGKSCMDVWMNVCETVAELDGYDHPSSAHMYPMLSTDTRAMRLDKAQWHDSWTLQAGHAGTFQEKTFYSSYYYAKNIDYVKPFIEGEANYEDINCGGFTGYDANRISAWKAMLCGSAGFTYGSTGVWLNCYSTQIFTSGYGGESSFSYEPWYMGLDKPGSYEITYMMNFFKAIGNWYDLVPRYSSTAYATFLTKEVSLLSSTEDKSTAVAYFYQTYMNEGLDTGTILCLDENQVYTAYWYNVLNGKYILIEEDIVPAGGMYTVPTRPSKQDWAFLITSKEIGPHYEEEMYVDLNVNNDLIAPVGDKVVPEKVTAIGGITYAGGRKDSQTMTDNTLYLYDGDASTVWIPSSNRTSQTFLFDLGRAYDLTGLTITPDDNTVIPKYRIEGSNDGKLWTVIVNATVRKSAFSGAASEKLQGAYRYVKVILDNPETHKPSEINNFSYEVMLNEYTQSVYSVTRIKDIEIYASGVASGIKDEILIGAPVIPDENVSDGGTIGAISQIFRTGGAGNIIIIYALATTGVVVVMTAGYVIYKRRKHS